MIIPTTMIKAKLNTFKNKFSHKKEKNYQRKLSDTSSVGTHDSAASIAEKFLQVLPFFRTKSQTSTTSSNLSNEEDSLEKLEKLRKLYQFAIEELCFAKDSVGSFYYSGDLLAAHEALDDFANKFMQLIDTISDSGTRERIRASMTPKLIQLQAELSNLPKEHGLISKEREEFGF